jgi:hypothetical protein
MSEQVDGMDCYLLDDPAVILIEMARSGTSVAFTIDIHLTITFPQIGLFWAFNGDYSTL